MMKIRIFIFLFFSVLITFGQESKKAVLFPNRVGFIYNNANEKNFLFDDLDYSYSTNTFKAQAFYNLFDWQSFQFDLIVQPQVQVLKHKLLNEQFVLPNEDNYQQKRIEFTSDKTIYLYATEFSFAIKKQLINKLNLQVTIGLGLAIIDTRTERLAKGFTFIENGSLGFTYDISKKTALYFGSNIGHVSNFDFQSPNNGYNVLGLEIGFSYLLK